MHAPLRKLPTALIRTDRDQWHFFRRNNPPRDRAGYESWIHALKKKGALPVEYLTDRIVIPFSESLPPSMQLSAASEPLNNIPKANWGYWFPFGGGRSTLDHDPSAERRQKARYLSTHRLRMIGETLSHLYSGSLSNLSCLDMGCNWGAFTLEMAARGADAIGIDLRADNIQRANALRAHVKLENARFNVCNAYEATGQYDIVLNLGLLYHVTDPIGLVQKTYNLCKDVAIIETVTHKEPFSGFVLGDSAQLAAKHAGGAIHAKLHPTYRALLDMMQMAGFKDLIEIEAEPDPTWHDFDTGVLGSKSRRAVMGFK